MKKLLILILLYGLHAKANTDDPQKSVFILQSKIGYLSLSSPLGKLIPSKDSLYIGYGDHLINLANNSYIGFVELYYSLDNVIEWTYGYEFMRQNTFSFGFHSAVVVTFKNLGLGLGIGAFMRVNIVEFASIALQINTLYPIANDEFKLILVPALSTRIYLNYLVNK